MLHGKPPVSTRYIIEPRCLIRSYGSTGSFPDDFVDLRKMVSSAPAPGKAAGRIAFRRE